MPSTLTVDSSFGAPIFWPRPGFRYVISSGLQWRRGLRRPGPRDRNHRNACRSTPATGTMYLVAKTKVYDTVTHTTSFYPDLACAGYQDWLGQGHAGVKFPPPTPGTGTGSVGGILTFDPLVEAQRSALLLLKGQVFVAWASHCDLGAYHGYLMSFNESNPGAQWAVCRHAQWLRGRLLGRRRRSVG